MKVSRLEIFGFKSFVDRFVLNFDKNIIGIVGPNGCGKSNIVDALRWVLGETQAKQLRGALLEDLIFNGSGGRRPMGMAEVSLTLRPNEGWKLDGSGSDEDPEVQSAFASLQEGAQAEKPSPEQLQWAQVPSSLGDILPALKDAAEIQFTRRSYRSGESEYFINKVPCRLRDLLDVYRAIGLGARGLAIVQQGSIGQFLAKKPVERRELIEEAAGISGFRVRLEVGERKLEKNRESISRLKDLISEVEKNVRSLKRQADRARNREGLRAKLQELDLDLYRRRLARVVREEGVLAARSGELTASEESLKEAITSAKARHEELQASLQEFENSWEEARIVREALTQAESDYRRRENEARLILKSHEDKAEASARRRARLDEERGRIGAELNGLRTNYDGAIAERDRAAGVLAETEQALAHMQSDGAAAEGEAPQTDPAMEQTLQEIATARADLEAMPQVREQLNQAESRFRHLEQELRGEERNGAKLENARAGVQAGITLLENQLASLASQTVGAITGDKAKSLFGDRKDSVLLAGLHVPEDLQRAVSAVLGERAEYLVSATPQEYLAAYASRPSHTAALKVGVVRSDTGSAQGPLPLTDEERSADPEAKLLVDCVRCDEAVKGAIFALLGDVVVASSLTSAGAMTELAVSPRRIYVTRAGEIAAAWGWCTTSGQAPHLSIPRRLDDLRRDLKTAEEQLAGKRADIERLRAGLAEQETTVTDLRRQLSDLQSLQRRLSELLEGVRRVERAKQAEVERRRQEQLRQEREAQQRVRQAADTLSKAEGTLRVLRQRSASLEERLHALDAEQEHLEAERAEALSKADEERRRGAELSTSTITLPGLDGRQFASIEELRAALKACIDDAEGGRRERDELRQQLRRVENDVRSSEGRLMALHEGISDLSVKARKIELEREFFTEEFSRQYEVPTIEPQELTALLEMEGDALDGRISELENGVRQLRARIEREGEVDPQSIELHAAEEQRLSDLQRQLSDLEEASRLIEKTMDHLKQLSKQRFLVTFDAVKTKFEELIPRLFGGGSGVMELSDKENPLSSGIELAVRPPGKKLKSTDVMSGGEKALVASAVLLSVFLFKPGPICVLDEVDAPLDDANLQRFHDLIRELAKTTQCLMITHNKVSMSMVDRLIGITMQESGVSSALSVSLEEAEEVIVQAVANA